MTRDFIKTLFDEMKLQKLMHSLLMIEKTAFIDLATVIICLFTLANFWESMRKSRN